MISERDIPRRVTHWQDKSILMCDRHDLLNLANHLAHLLDMKGVKAPGVRLSDVTPVRNQPRLATAAVERLDRREDGQN